MKTIEKQNPILDIQIKKIEKRSKDIVAFDQSKITEAILKALTSTDQGGRKKANILSKKVVNLLKKRLKKDKIPNVEQIQDIVEEVLILNGLVEAAKAYILYREQRRRIREMEKIESESVEKIDQYLEEDDWEVRENANMSYSLQGLNNYVTSSLVKKYWLEKVYPPNIRHGVEQGDFHIHDLQTLGAYCCGWDLYDLLLRGFGGVAGKIQSKPAKHFRTALGQIVNFLYTAQGEIAGAVAFSNFDTLLSPFIRYDHLSYSAVKQGLQEFLFNMNVPTRVGFQTPFSNLTFDITCSPIFADTPVVIGGKSQKETYSDFQGEMDILNQAFYDLMLGGDAHSRVFGFPIPTINITKDFPWDKKALVPMWEATAKYGVNYFGNYVNSDMKPEDVRSMCKLPSTEIIYKNARNVIAKTEIRRIVNDFIKTNNPVEILINGEFKSVKDIIKLRLENKDILKIILDNGTIDKMTLDHPSVIVDKGKLKLIESRNLKVGDEFPLAKHPYKGDLGDFDLGRMVGLYSGDGWFSHDNTTLNYVFNQKEEKLIKFVQKIAETRFVAATTTELNHQHHYHKISIASRSLVELMKEYIRGDGSLTKRLNSKTYSRCIEFRKGVLVGMIENDGLINRTRNYAEIHLGNKNLILDFLILARSLGINTTYFESKNRTGRKEKIAYSLRFAGDVSSWLRTYFGLRKGKNLKYREYKDFYGVKIKKIEKIKYTGYVYDFEIDSKKHLFQLANGIITHNCCRLRLDTRKLYNRGGGGLFGSGSLTGSIGVVTINLVKIGYLAKNKQDFLERLGKNMDLAKQSLEIKRKTVEKLTEKGLYPYCKYWLSGIKKMRQGYWKNHFSTIGLIGMNESLLNFMGKDVASKQGRAFSLEILDFMRKRLLIYQEETSNLYNLEASPAEGTSFRLALKDRKEYPDIITAGTKEKPYYTNSSQLAVNYTDDAFEALELQDDLQCKYTGGCIEKGNKVLTNKGLILIEDIVKNFKTLKPIKALSFNVKNKIGEWDNITETFKINVAKNNKIRVEGERNLDITTSDWHPFFVLEKFIPNSICPICKEKISNINSFATHIRWHPECREKYSNYPKYKIIKKRADELEQGDYILQNSNNLYPNRVSKLNNDLMWLIGFFIGDGCISLYNDNRGNNNLQKYKVRFFSEDANALKKVARVLNQHFDCNVKVIKNDKRSEVLKEVSASKEKALNFFFKYGFKAGKKVYNVSISDIIKKNITKENVFSLLSGLIDSDGTIDKRSGDIEYFTVSPQLAEDILEISILAGIMISKTEKIVKRKNEVNIWRLRIPSYEATRIRNKLNVEIDFKRIRKKLSNRKKRHFPVVRVKKVSKTNVRDNQFYDLTTKKNHNYLAGKNCLVFVHNTVLHLFLGEKLESGEQSKKLVKKVFEQFKLPYITISPTFSVCPVHGYLSGEHFYCPKCAVKQPCEVYSRVVGFLRPVSHWNDGKQQEFAERKEFKLKKKK